MSRSEAVSVIIPVFNEAPNLALLQREITEALDPLGREYEIVYVDDASTDGSFESLESIASADPHVRVVRFARHCGQTGAMQARYRPFPHRGRSLVFLDADLQTTPGTYRGSWKNRGRV